MENPMTEKIRKQKASNIRLLKTDPKRKRRKRGNKRQILQ